MKMLAKYDARNPDALRRLLGQGAKLAFFPKEVLDAAYKASHELYGELSEKNPDFKAMLPQWKAFQLNQASWFRVADSALDNYTFAAVTAKPK
jgi:TRAP-type mannitol/chloroaromatic compound transport system substrate-binding protein